MNLFRRAKPLPSREEIVSQAMRYAAKYGASKRADAARRMIRAKCVELRQGPVAPIAPRDVVVADVRARRA